MNRNIDRLLRNRKSSMTTMMKKLTVVLRMSMKCTSIARSKVLYREIVKKRKRRQHIYSKIGNMRIMCSSKWEVTSIRHINLRELNLIMSLKSNRGVPQSKRKNSINSIQFQLNYRKTNLQFIKNIHQLLRNSNKQS